MNVLVEYLGENSIRDSVKISYTIIQNAEKIADHAAIASG